jgi:hypothetical protein
VQRNILGDGRDREWLGVKAARIEEMGFEIRGVTREVADSTTTRKWKLLFVIVTNLRARFVLRRDF